MPQIADFIARHAVAVLLLVTCAWLLITAVFWRAVHVYGPRVWSWALRTWQWWKTTPLARRLLQVPVAGPAAVRTINLVRYLGVHAVIGFAVALAAAVAFAELADEIGVDETLAQFDANLAHELSQHVSMDVLRAFAVVTYLGDRDVLIGLAILVAIVLLILKRWLLAGAWAVATTGGGVLNLLLKSIFERPRPLHDHGLVTETSFSFPSGHASGSMLIYSLLGYLVVRHTPPQWHIPVAIGMSALIIFVGSSRVILQVHYFSDVLAGYASAAAWVALCIAGLEAARWREDAAGKN
jgi:membrane-associated phospholipid phosphatase